MKYLGFIIEAKKGISIDLAKVEVILMSLPTKVCVFRAFR